MYTVKVMVTVGLTLPKTSTEPLTLTHQLRYLKSRTGEFSGPKKNSGVFVMFV